MGTWGTGLYSGDFAADLRGAVGAVARLPFDGPRLLAILTDAESAAIDPDATEHCVFWLVTADQFAKRGIACDEARDRALAIIDSGRDLATMAALGMTERDLGSRRAMLMELRARLVAPAGPEKARSTLKKPQPLLLRTGDLIAYPTAGGQCINAYFPTKDAITGGWHQDGWGAALIVETGHVLGFLAWYRPLIAPMGDDGKPDRDGLLVQSDWVLKRPGTLSATHLKRLEIETIASLTVDAASFDAMFPGRPSGRSEAVNDIGLCNQLSHSRPGVALRPPPVVPDVRQIVRI